MAPDPKIIPHPLGDHRCIDVSEISNHGWYGVRSSTVVPSQIAEFIERDGPAFLKPTSSWNETHLTAFKVIHLQSLHPSRILPASIVPAEDDPVVRWLRQNLSATEDEIRTGRTGMGPAHSFYGQLRTVLRRPSAPNPSVATSMALRMTTSTPVSIPSPRNVNTGIQITSNRINAILSPESAMSTDSSFHPSSSPGARTQSSLRGSSEEDKAEIASNQMAVTLMDSLCQLERHLRPELSQHISFRS